MIKDFTRYTLLLGALWCLGGCSNLALREAVSSRQWPSEWTQRRAALQEAERFEISGRLAIARGESGATAALRWQQRGEESIVEIEGPLGLAANRFHYRPGEEILWRKLEAQLGFALPAASFRYWLLGVPDPSSAAVEQQAEDEALPVLRTLEQAGWQLEYQRYAEVSDQGLRLPARIEARSADADGEPVRVRVLIQRWTRLP